MGCLKNKIGLVKMGVWWWTWTQWVNRLIFIQYDLTYVRTIIFAEREVSPYKYLIYFHQASWLRVPCGFISKHDMIETLEFQIMPIEQCYFANVTFIFRISFSSYDLQNWPTWSLYSPIYGLHLVFTFNVVPVLYTCLLVFILTIYQWWWITNFCLFVSVLSCQHCWHWWMDWTIEGKLL